MSDPTVQELAHMLSSIDETMVRYQRSYQKTELVSVPSRQHVAQIVGRNGYKIKNLRAATKTMIKTPLMSDVPVFSVTGTEQNVRKAVDAIRMASQHFDNVLKNKSGVCAVGEIQVKIHVPVNCVGAVVGPKGQTIISIKEQTNTRINTPKKGTPDPVFEVMGSPANVEAAKQAIEQRMKTAFNHSIGANPDQYDPLVVELVDMMCDPNHQLFNI